MKKIFTCLLISVFFVPFSMFSQNEFLDLSFGTNGIVYQNYTDTATGVMLESDFKAIVLQSNGSFITASNFHLHGNNPRYIINRYTKRGILDTTFGVNGFVTGNLQNTIGGLELQSDGRIIGFSWDGIYPPFSSYIFRLNTDGSIDGSFGTSGIITDSANNIRAISVQANDKILAAKMHGNNRALPGFSVMRYNPDGTPDTDFGNNGTIDFSLSQANISLHDIVSQRGRKILISGIYGGTGPGDYRRDIFFMRLNDDGSLDSTFGEDGVKVLDFDDVDNIVNVLVQSNGKTVISGLSYGLLAGNDVVNRLIRLNTDGNLDTTFGTDGIKTIEYPILELQSLKELSNGKIMASGTYETSENPSPSDNQEPVALVIARYEINGDLDSSFGNNGYITTTLNFRSALNDRITVQPDGKILVGATFCEAWMSCHPHTVVLRYDPEQRLSASDMDKNNAFVLYPNPFNETVTVDFTLDQSEVLAMDLYSYDGRKVVNLLKDQSFQAGFNSQKLAFPSTLAGGIYFLNIFNGRETFNIKIIK